MSLEFQTEFDPRYGQAVKLSPWVTRITAHNPGPFTFMGTNSYLIGSEASDSVDLIDPGPDETSHINALLRAIGHKTLKNIFVTHTHKDHSPGTAILVKERNATVFALGGHQAYDKPLLKGVTPMDGSIDWAFQPDVMLENGAVIQGDDWTVTAISTPGHTRNHCAFYLDRDNALFCGDHVMGWSTSIVAPPDGNMADYMASLNTLLARNDACYYPGHGDVIEAPQTFVQALKQHRVDREGAILTQLAQHPMTISDLVDKIYIGLDDKLKPAAALSVLAQIEHLYAQGSIGFEGEFTLQTPLFHSDLM